MKEVSQPSLCLRSARVYPSHFHNVSHDAKSKCDPSHRTGYYVAEQTFEKLHKIGRKVTVGNFSDFALNNWSYTSSQQSTCWWKSLPDGQKKLPNISGTNNVNDTNMRLVSKWSLACKEQADVHNSKYPKCDLHSLMWWVTHTLSPQSTECDVTGDTLLTGPDLYLSGQAALKQRNNGLLNQGWPQRDN
jgi:hypothetical protein